MNARASLFVTVRQGPAGAKLLAGAGACLLLAGCMGNPFEDAKVDPRSPIAAEVAGSVHSDAAYPTFASIPAVPKDVRPRRQFGEAAAQSGQAKTALEQATADDKWTLRNTATFVAEARAAAGPDLAPADPADTEAFARALRKRATPPPPTKR